MAKIWGFLFIAYGLFGLLASAYRIMNPDEQVLFHLSQLLPFIENVEQAYIFDGFIAFLALLFGVYLYRRG